MLFKYRLKFLLPFGDTASVAASVPTGVRLTRGGLTLGVRARNAAHIACLLSGSCKSAPSSWVLVYRRISLLRFPPSSVLVSFLSPSVFPASLLVSPPGLKIPPVTITNRRRGDLLPAAECLVAANTAGGRVDATGICGSARAGAATRPLEVLVLTAAAKHPWRGRTRTETKEIRVSKSPQGGHAKMGFLLFYAGGRRGANQAEGGGCCRRLLEGEINRQRLLAADFTLACVTLTVRRRRSGESPVHVSSGPAAGPRPRGGVGGVLLFRAG